MLLRYHLADGHARAVADAAIAAERLGRWANMPRVFLRDAAVGYLDNRTRDLTGPEPTWFNQALAYLTAPGDDSSGPVLQAAASGDKCPDGEHDRYKLSDSFKYVKGTDQDQDSPPASFWQAVLESCDDGVVILTLADAASARGRLQRQHQLIMRAHVLDPTNTIEHLLRSNFPNHWAPGFLAQTVSRLEANGFSLFAEILACTMAEGQDFFALIALATTRAQLGDIMTARRLRRFAAGHGYKKPNRSQTADNVRPRPLPTPHHDRRPSINTQPRTPMEALAVRCGDYIDSGHSEDARRAWQSAADAGLFWQSVFDIYISQLHQILPDPNFGLTDDGADAETWSINARELFSTLDSLHDFFNGRGHRT
ncbi:hypothetical protein ACFXPS_17795 [Nocardia sp. NPDC059091]|uniref:hypothetical protein n=1 Tax=Nocardia sp. NPDC059091 TaxID=3346724 RepID=UPI00367D458D